MTLLLRRASLRLAITTRYFLPRLKQPQFSTLEAADVSPSALRGLPTNAVMIAKSFLDACKPMVPRCGLFWCARAPSFAARRVKELVWRYVFTVRHWLSSKLASCRILAITLLLKYLSSWPRLVVPRGQIGCTRGTSMMWDIASWDMLATRTTVPQCPAVTSVTPPGATSRIRSLLMPLQFSHHFI